MLPPSLLTSTSNLEDLVKGIKMIAALMDDEDDPSNLLDAAKKLAGAFSDLLNALRPGENRVRVLVVQIMRKSSLCRSLFVNDKISSIFL